MIASSLLVASLLSQPVTTYVRRSGDTMTGPLDSRVASGGRAFSLLAGAKFCLDGTTCALYVTGTGWVGVFTINGSLVVTSTVAGTNAIAATAAGNGNGVVGNSVGTNSGVQGNNTTTTTGNGVGGTCSGVGSSCNAVNGLQNDSTGAGAAVRAKQNGVGPGLQVDASAGTGYGINFVLDTTSPARGAIHFQCQDSNPSTSANGDFYCNSASSNHPRWYNGSWRDFNISGSANSGLSYTATATSGNQSFIQTLGARHCLDGATCSVYLAGVDAATDYAAFTGNVLFNNTIGAGAVNSGVGTIEATQSNASLAPLWIKHSATNGYSELYVVDSSSTYKMALGYANSNVSKVPWRSKNFIALAADLQIFDGSDVLMMSFGTSAAINAYYPVTLDKSSSAGTPGNATINKPAGASAIAAAATGVTITNSMATATSVIHVTRLGSDATCTGLYVTNRASGSFDVVCDGLVAATGNLSFMWSVH